MLRHSQGKPPRHGWSLRSKTILLVASAMLMVTLASFLIVSSVLFSSLGTLQKEVTTQRIDRVIRQLNQLVRQQRNAVLDNATWDETFDFLRGQTTGYLEKNFNPATGTTGQDLVLLFDRQKNLFDAMVVTASQKASKDLPPYFDPDQVRHSGLLRDGQVGSALVASPTGLLLLSAFPVRRTDGSGQSPGWLVYGLNVGEEWFAEMRDVTGVEIAPSYPATTMTDSNLRQGETLAMDGVGECRIFIAQRDFRGGDPGGISALVKFENTIGPAPAELNLTVPSIVFAPAMQLRRQIVWSFFLAALALTVCCILSIEFLFIRKIHRLDREFQRGVVEAAAGSPAGGGPGDEIERLEYSANRIFDALRRRQTEAENQEKLLSSVLDGSPNGVMAFRSQRNEKREITDFFIVLANKAAENIARHPASEMLGKTLLTVFPGTKAEGLFERYVRVVECRIGDHFDILYHHEGIEAWLEIFAEPWQDGFVITFGEITSRKHVEQELNATVEELERFNRAMLGREERVLELKSEVNRLRQQLGLPPEYSNEDGDHAA